MKSIKHLLGIVSIALLFGCSNQDRLTTQGQQRIAFVEEFERLFPNCVHEVGKTELLGSETKWISKAIVCDRYVVSMFFNVSISKFGSSVQKEGDAGFEIVEVTGLRMEGGLRCVSYGEQMNFSEEEWGKLVNSKGDFTAVSFEVKEGPAIEGIDKLLRL